MDTDATDATDPTDPTDTPVAPDPTDIDPDVILLGTGELTRPIFEALGGEHDAVVVTNDPAYVDDDRHEFIVVEGDPSDGDVLRQAGIETCGTLIVATNDDQLDALSILTARDLNPDARIVAAATNRENMSKLDRAGADEVLSPATIGSAILVDSALKRQE